MDAPDRGRRRVGRSKQDVCDWRPNPPCSENRQKGFEPECSCKDFKASPCYRKAGTGCTGEHEGGSEGANRTFATGDRIPPAPITGKGDSKGFLK